MAKLIVEGGYRICGRSRVCGAKNAVLPILAACVLIDQPVLLHDCPRLTDADNMLEILKTIGCEAERDGETLFVNAARVDAYELPEHLSKELRSSFFLLGPMLGRFGRASVTHPGGCEIGNRPIDLHLSGLAALGARITERNGRILCACERLRGAEIHLDYPSVGATENVMLAAVAAEGETVLHNAAREPEIADLQNFLLAAGFTLCGAGSSTIRVQGGGKARAVSYTVMPDRIVAGTLLTAAAMTRGDVTLENISPAHLAGTLSKLSESGCRIETSENTVRCVGPVRPRELKRVETLPHPGFPTDMQAQIFALCSVADGTSILVENVFENRFKHAQELERMGARSLIRGQTAVIRGVERLTGADVTAHDLRGGAALVLAGLAAEGETRVEHAEHIDRGYARLENMLSALGASIRRAEK